MRIGWILTAAEEVHVLVLLHSNSAEPEAVAGADGRPTPSSFSPSVGTP
jgi:hypothetical protein